MKRIRSTNKSFSTSLIKLIWELKDKNKECKQNWVFLSDTNSHKIGNNYYNFRNREIFQNFNFYTQTS